MIPNKYFLIFISRSIGSSEHWICSKCTLRNPLSALKCRVCENSRKLPKTATNHSNSSHSSSNSIINSKCTVCTYVNVSGRKKCEMCSTSLKSQNIITMAPTPATTPSTVQPAPPSSQTVAALTANCKFWWISVQFWVNGVFIILTKLIYDDQLYKAQFLPIFSLKLYSCLIGIKNLLFWWEKV